MALGTYGPSKYGCGSWSRSDCQLRADNGTAVSEIGEPLAQVPDAPGTGHAHSPAVDRQVRIRQLISDGGLVERADQAAAAGDLREAERCLAQAAQAEPELTLLLKLAGLQRVSCDEGIQGVVHHGLRESIEVFDLDVSRKDPALTWVGCVVAPESATLNAVAPLPWAGAGPVPVHAAVTTTNSAQRARIDRPRAGRGPSIRQYGRTPTAGTPLPAATRSVPPRSGLAVPRADGHCTSSRTPPTTTIRNP